jgi:Uma2 family endonuclease
MQHAPAIAPSRPAVYPESDGKPMAETDLHFAEMVALRDALEDRYRGAANVYVGGNSFLYYEEGNLGACVSPDLYVVKGVAKHQRRTFRLWEEAAAPCFVMEVSSRSTWDEDIYSKKPVYRRLGVAEYLLYDPEARAVVPPLQGFRLAGGKYRPIRARSRPPGALLSKQLGLVLWLDGRLRLQVTDAATGAVILRREKVREALRQAERQLDQTERQREQEKQLRRQAEGRAADARAALCRAILAVLQARGLDVPAEVAARIRDCQDPDRLERWLSSAGTVTAAGELS